MVHGMPDESVDDGEVDSRKNRPPIGALPHRLFFSMLPTWCAPVGSAFEQLCDFVVNMLSSTLN